MDGAFCGDSFAGGDVEGGYAVCEGRYLYFQGVDQGTQVSDVGVLLGDGLRRGLGSGFQLDGRRAHGEAGLVAGEVAEEDVEVCGAQSSLRELCRVEDMSEL